MKLGAKIKLPLSQLVEFLQKLGAKEPELDSRFIASVHEIDHVVNVVSDKDKNGIHPYIDALQSSNGTATISLHWMGDSDGENSDQQIGMDYIQHHILPLIPRAQRRNILVAFYYFSWSGVTRKKAQSETWTTVWAAQTWNGFLMPQNNTRQVWKSIYKDMTTMFRYCTFLSPNIELWGGAISKVANNDTAFSHRQAVYNVGVQLLVPNGTKNAEHVFQDQAALVSAVWPSIAKHLKGVYVNYPMPSLSKEEYPRAYWGDNLERLMELKEQYDPDHVMRYEQSIPGKNESFYSNLEF
jgi:FAD/FMN-containing dehydrogenase